MKKYCQLVLVCFVSGFLLSCGERTTSQGDQAYDRGEYSEAEREYSKELAVDPSNLILLFNRARALEEQGKWEEALVDFEKAHAFEPKNFKVILAISNLHYSQDNYPRSLIWAKKAEEISGAPALASFMKGRALHKLGHTEDALKAYGAAIQIDKEFGEAYFYRGLLKIALKQRRAACEDFHLANALEYPHAAEAIGSHCKK